MQYGQDKHLRGGAMTDPHRDTPLATPADKRHVFIVGGMVVFFVTLIVMACLFAPHIPLPRF